jgi:GntR family transcriptional regulator of arabinose operon
LTLISKLSKKERTKLLHTQLTNYYRERILDGRLTAGTRLPTDEELANEYQISRDAVRQALSLLVTEGLIERVQGRGTFVCQPPTNTNSQHVAAQKQIGLVLNRTSSTLPNMDILIGVEQVVKLQGYSVSFTYSDGNQEQQARDIARLRANHMAGLIVYPVGEASYDASIAQLQAARIPVVLIDRYLTELETDYVGIDNVGGGYRATEHLLILGHRRIGFMYSYHESLRTTSVYERWQGYCKALQKYGIPYDETLVVPDCNPPQSNQQEGITAFLQRPDRPSAIFAVNDYVALGILQAAHALHIPLPESLAVVGFDDNSFAAHLTPPLTTVAQPFMDIGMRAATLLLSRLEGLDSPPKHIELPTNLIIRESCGAQQHIKRTLHAP